MKGRRAVCDGEIEIEIHYPQVLVNIHVITYSSHIHVREATTTRTITYIDVMYIRRARFATTEYIHTIPNRGATTTRTTTSDNS